MNRMQAFVGGLVLVVGSSAITSAVIPQDSGNPWDMYCVPGPEHDMMSELAGRWSLDISATLEEDEDPVEATLTSDYRWIFGGRFLVGEISGYVGGELFQARELLGFDRYRGEYTSVWGDNMTTAFETSRGAFDKRTKTLTMEGLHDDVELDRRDLKFKNVWKFEDDDSYTMTVWREGADGKMVKRAEIHATRLE